jgi:hypothetical protein
MATAAEIEYEELTGEGSLSVLESQTRGEIDIQISTAKKWPRSIKKFKETAQEMATLDEETAAACIYALPRAGKTIEGPSARLAEIILSAWGNSRAGARTVSDDGNFVIAQGAFHDLERNIAISFEVRRRIVGSNGKRYSDDMIGTTANAACSIALRNAVLKGVPKAFWSSIYEAAKRTAVGKAETLANRRAAMLEYFQKMGVPSLRVFNTLQVKGVDDITLEHLFVLKGLATAIKEGDTTVDEAFGTADPKTPKTTTTAKEMMQEPESQLPPVEAEDVSQDVPTPDPEAKKAAKPKEQYGDKSPGWPAFEEQLQRVGNNQALAAKERLGWMNTPFNKLRTEQLIELTSALKTVVV